MNSCMIEVNNPFIKTIPEECAPFLLLKKNTEEFKKFVMENNVAFYAFDFKDHTSDGITLRFDNYLNWGVYEGFCTSFVPRCVLLSYDYIEGIVQFLEKGFLVMCRINKFYINAYEENKESSHKIIIHGFNNEKKYFACQDFINGRFNKFIVQFDELHNAIANYPWHETEKDGLWAIKCKKEQHNVSYIRLLNEVNKLTVGNEYSYNTGIETFGVAALKMFSNGIISYTSDPARLYRCFYWINYVRESCKLMKLRVNYLKDDFSKYNFCEIEKILDNMRMNIDKEYFYISKCRIYNCFLQKPLMDILEDFSKISSMYMTFAINLKNILTSILNSDYSIEQMDGNINDGNINKVL